MLLQQELFPPLPPSLSLKALLQQRAREGHIFYKPKDVARLLKVSGFQVYYAITRYRLDAVMVCGEYRIPWFSIVEFLENQPQIKRQFWAFQHYVNSHVSEKDIYISENSDIYEDAPQDYYGLKDLHIPTDLRIEELANILEVSTTLLIKDGHFGHTVPWPDAFDYLVEREVCNLPVFERDLPMSTGEIEKIDEEQLMLF
ncbi:helix-turn-helix domain-containing protein [Parasphaerochaeta coccoides]|uniref:Helix-turn-helix domain-containing protein n=1 Tax=Parasphaerochaeta coccoides (strain ATCC BAA-1237 / DSM 17374 / SPN1) TaxID=760011 RepID=F4GHU9_PARC1|nr:helix-turn-helix domain-containing protein [Parasphaerochaeta coccoides]AEC02062.1 hypothetical protein Spico_0838 [Parasphaerochaeta coccoides DSM 17374]